MGGNVRIVRAIGLAALGAGVVAVAGRAAAQRAAPSRTAAWASVGVGKAVLPQGSDIAVHLEGSYQFGSSVVSLRAASASSIVGAIINAILGSAEDIEAHDFALLYGRATRPAAWHSSAAAGVGIVVVERDSAGTRTTTRRVTFPVEAQFAWRPLHALGIVVCGFGSFNSRQSFGGVTVGLELGRLR